MIRFRALLALVPAALVVMVAACAGNSSSGSLPPNATQPAQDHVAAINMQSPPPDDPISTTGTITGIIKGEGFAMQTGAHGYMDVEVTSATTISGGTIAVGDQVSVSGTGTFATFILATAVTIVGPTPTPSPTPTPAPLPSVISLDSGHTWGQVPTLWPILGSDTNGGHGQPIDGLSCGAMVDNSFHVHAFLGVLVNGVPLRVEPGIGVENPGQPVNGFMNSGTCFYNIHTHDADGYIHMEALSSTPLSGSMFTLGNVLDMWGETISPTNFGGYNGPVRVFTARTPLAKTLTPAGPWSEIISTTGLEWSSMPLYSHTAVMIEVGPYFVPAANLPQISFYTEY